eukprot:33117-Pyramimonas_sp.AAC.1
MSDWAVRLPGRWGEPSGQGRRMDPAIAQVVVFGALLAACCAGAFCCLATRLRGGGSKTDVFPSLSPSGPPGSVGGAPKGGG